MHVRNCRVCNCEVISTARKPKTLCSEECSHKQVLITRRNRAEKNREKLRLQKKLWISRNLDRVRECARGSSRRRRTKYREQINKRQNAWAREKRKRQGRGIGMLGRPYLNLTGKTFGRLTVVNLAGRTRLGKLLWECRCSCGNPTTVKVDGTRLRRRHTASCGCARGLHSPRRLAMYKRISEMKTHSVDARSLMILSQKYRESAKRRGHTFTLTQLELEELFFSNCFYCGSPPEATLRLKGNGQRVKAYNGIDRVDNCKGYVADNVVSCCKYCNMAKGCRSAEAFLEWARKVSSHQLRGTLVKVANKSLSQAYEEFSTASSWRPKEGCLC